MRGCRTSLLRGGAQCSDLRVQSESKRVGPCLGLTGAGAGQGLFRVSPIENRDRRLHAEHATQIAIGGGRRFGPTDNLRVPNQAAIGCP